MIKEEIGTGATVEEAKASALLKLGISEYDEFTVEVLQNPTKKILGLFGGSPAKVKVTTEICEKSRITENPKIKSLKRRRSPRKSQFRRKSPKLKKALP